jgi:hypothetical protein
LYILNQFFETIHLKILHIPKEAFISQTVFSPQNVSISSTYKLFNGANDNKYKLQEETSSVSFYNNKVTELFTLTFFSGKLPSKKTKHIKTYTPPHSKLLRGRVFVDFSIKQLSEKITTLF